MRNHIKGFQHQEREWRPTALKGETKTQTQFFDGQLRAGLSVGTMALGFALVFLQNRRQSMLGCP